MPIPPGYASVTVEQIVVNNDDLELDFVGGDGEKTLGDAVHEIVLWCKVDIKLIANTTAPVDPNDRPSPHHPSPPSTHPASPSSPPGQRATSTPTPPAPEKGKKKTPSLPAETVVREVLVGTAVREAAEMGDRSARELLCLQ